jgi:tetratricopeptide (TPR) repeat protein
MHLLSDTWSGFVGWITGQRRRNRQAAASAERRKQSEALRRDRRPPDLAALRAGVVQSPQDPSARLRLGWGLFGAREYAEALDVFQRGRQDFPQEADLLYGFALAAKVLGKADPADEAFLEAAAAAEKLADPGRSEILHRLAMGHHNHVRTGRWGLKREIWGGD